jgi:hypothetical protein
MDFVLRSTGKAMGGHGIKWGEKNLLDLDYADDLSILDENVSKMNELRGFASARIGLKINVKKTKSLRLGIREDEKLTLGNEKIYQYVFPYAILYIYTKQYTIFFSMKKTMSIKNEQKLF